MLRVSKIKKKLSAPTASALETDTLKSIGNKKRVHDDAVEFKRRKKQLMLSDVMDANDDTVAPLQVHIPLTLKKHLVDEWKIVTSSPNRLLTLPRPHVISDLMEEYLSHKKSKVNEGMVELPAQYLRIYAIKMR